MTQLLRRFYPLGTVGGAIAPTGSLFHAYVLGKLNYFEGNYPFIDVTKSGVGFNNFSGASTRNAKGWLTSLAPGASATMLVVVNASWFPPGDYKVVSTSAASISLSATGVTNYAGPAVGTLTFTVPDQGSDDNWAANFSLNISVSNGTGAAIAVTDLKCYLVANQALVAIGEIFDPAYVAGIAGAKFLRFTEWMGLNNTHGWQPDSFWKYADLGVQDLDKTSYLPIQGAGGPCIPAMILLAKKIGARPWIPVPHAANQVLCRYSASTNTLSAKEWYNPSFTGVHKFANGVGLRLAVGNDPGTMNIDWKRNTLYVINATSSTFQVSLSVNGAPFQLAAIDLSQTDDSQFGFGYVTQITGLNEIVDMFQPIAQCCYDTDPSCQPVVEYSNEVWNGGYNVYTYVNQILCQVLIGTGYQSTGHLSQSMKVFRAFENVFGPSSIGRVVAWFTGLLQGYLAMTDVNEGLNHLDTQNIYDSTKTYGQILLQAPSRCFYAVAPYLRPWNAGLSAYNAPTAYADAGNAVPNSGFWDAAFNRSIDYNANNSQAGMTAITASLNTYLPGVNLCFYEWGQEALWGYTSSAAYKATSQSYSDYLEGSAGQAMYERAWQALVVPNNVYSVNWYSSEGSRVISLTAMSHWGIRNRDTDNPTSIWFRTKGGYSTGANMYEEDGVSPLYAEDGLTILTEG